MNFIVKYKHILLTIFILGSSLFVYYPAIFFDFLLYDDNFTVITNPYVLKLDVLSAFRYAYYLDYFPITTIYFALINKFFSLDPFYYHLGNIIFHFFNGFLCYLLALKVFHFSKGVSLLFTFLFLIHPMHVESVVWITEAKDVLSTFFLLLSWLAFNSYKSRERGVLLGLAIIFFFLSLASKPISVMFPIALTLYYGWVCHQGGILDIKKNIIPVIPFFFLSALFGVIRMYAFETKIIILDQNIKFFGLIFQLMEKYIFYFSRSLFPYKLSGHYPEELFKPFIYEYFLVFIFLALMVVIIFLEKKKSLNRKLIFFVIFTLVMLFPMLRVIPFGVDFAVADRYMYLPSLGLYALFSFMLSKLFTVKHATVIASVYLMLIGTSLILYARERVFVWSHDLALWQDVYQQYPDSKKALHNLSVQYIMRKNPQQARLYQDRLIELDPYNYKNRINMLTPLIGENKIDEAIERLEELWKERPDYLYIMIALTELYYRNHDFLKALESAKGVFKNDPTHLRIHEIVRQILLVHPDEAMEAYREELIREYQLPITIPLK